MLANRSPNTYTHNMRLGERAVRHTKDIVHNIGRTFVNRANMVQRSFDPHHRVTWIASRHQQRMAARERNGMGRTWAQERHRQATEQQHLDRRLEQDHAILQSMLPAISPHFQHKFEDLGETQHMEAASDAPLNVRDHASVPFSRTASSERIREEKSLVTNALIELAARLEKQGLPGREGKAGWRRLESGAGPFYYQLTQEDNETTIAINDPAGYMKKGEIGVSCSVKFSRTSPQNANLRVNRKDQDAIEDIDRKSAEILGAIQAISTAIA